MIPSPLAARELRLLAHRAVTEGVDLKYVDRMRMALYAAADTIDRLDQKAQETPAHWRYKLVVEGNDYGKLSSLADLAGLIPDSESEWKVRTDKGVESGMRDTLIGPLWRWCRG